MKTTKMSIDKWEDTFKPVKNPFEDETSYNGMMFETYGDELAFIQSCAQDRVWTLVDSGRTPTIVNGFHHVNRLGYFVTGRPFESEKHYEIK